MRILLIGGTGLVGSRFVELFSKRLEIFAPTHDELDVTSEESIYKNLDKFRPDQVLYAAGFTNVDLAETEVDRTYQLNVNSPQTIAKKLAEEQTPFYYLSTDYVFSGRKDTGYSEEDKTDPVNSVYSKSKRDGEEVILGTSSKNSVIRLIMPFSAVFSKKLDIARLILTKLKSGEGIKLITDQKINPIFVDDLVKAIAVIMEGSACGIYHVGALDFTSPYKFGLEIARQFNLSTSLVDKSSFAEFSKSRLAARPKDSWLKTDKFVREFGNNILHTIAEEIRLFKSQVDA